MSRRHQVLVFFVVCWWRVRRAFGLPAPTFTRSTTTFRLTSPPTPARQLSFKWIKED
jgi:hypothetical protein